jgi:hypothetical protein
MDTPILVQPRNNQNFRPDEIIPFEWKLVPIADERVAFIRLRFIIGLDETQHFSFAYFKRTWLFQPFEPWTRLNETPNNLDLNPGTYYWQIYQEIPGFGMLFSDVRAIRVGGQPFVSPARVIRLILDNPFWVPHRSLSISGSNCVMPPTSRSGSPFGIGTTLKSRSTA